VPCMSCHELCGLQRARRSHLHSTAWRAWDSQDSSASLGTRVLLPASATVRSDHASRRPALVVSLRECFSARLARGATPSSALTTSPLAPCTPAFLARTHIARSDPSGPHPQRPHAHQAPQRHPRTIPVGGHALGAIRRHVPRPRHALSIRVFLLPVSHSGYPSSHTALPNCVALSARGANDTSMHLAPRRSKALGKATDKDFLMRVQEDIAEWRQCLADNDRMFCLKVRRQRAVMG
jgi:hypothetical protein